MKTFVYDLKLIVKRRLNIKLSIFLEGSILFRADV